MPNSISQNSSTSNLTKRHRSNSRPSTPTATQSNSSTVINSNTPSTSGKSFITTRPKTSRSKSNTPQPITLPFPDIAYRSNSRSRDGSRTASPTYTPLISPRGSQVEVTALLLMSGGTITGNHQNLSGNFIDTNTNTNTNTISSSPMSREDSDTTTPATASGSRSREPSGNVSRNSIELSTSNPTTNSNPINSPTSPPIPSPLRLNTSASVSHLPISEAGPSRLRAQTTATSTVNPTTTTHSRLSLSPPRMQTSNSAGSSTNSTPPILAPPTRIQGFHPTPLSSSNITASPTNSPTTARPSSLPTPFLSNSTQTGSTHSPTSKRLPDLPPPTRKTSSILAPTALSAAITPTAPTIPLTNHLYQAFVKGVCADVRLWVKKWGIGWKVHKMVLVQAGFFHSLFLGGFSETSAPIFNTKRKGKEKAVFEDDDDWVGEDLELQFDDPNITRAAFEICLSRLYSSYPQLHFPLYLLPTPGQPLTPAYSSPVFPTLKNAHANLPSNTQLATPRLLLSLLATSIYLGQTALMREALSMVLRTVGPMTVCRYVNFATGDGIGDEEWQGQAEEGARGLENVAKRLRRSGVETPIEHDEVEDLVEEHPHRDSADSSDGSKVGGTSAASVSRAISNASSRTLRGADPNLSISTPSPAVASSIFDESRMPHFYGFASNKIGEACACWLSRWGLDLLQAETSISSPGYKVWAQGGIPAKFIRAVLSSDALFVRDEMERYRAARKILDLRMRTYDEMDEGGDLSLVNEEEMEDDTQLHEDWEEEESEIIKVFADGIYYTHMTFEDLSTIASDINPHTSLPYAPLHILQAAHWSAADLKARIVNPGYDAPELGVSYTTTEITSPFSSRKRKPRSRVVSPAPGTFSSDISMSSSSGFFGSGKADTVYYPIPNDDTHRMGAGGLPFVYNSNNTTNNLPGLTGVPDLGPIIDNADLHETSPSATGGSNGTYKRPRPPHDEKTNFGLARSSRTLVEIHQSMALANHPPTAYSHLTPNVREPILSTARWSKIEPFRFSVEFFNIHQLAERERAYSTSHFYAGSWFNVYVQTIRKKDKGTQLGIYLHRQNPEEPFPIPSTPTQFSSMTSHNPNVTTEPNDTTNTNHNPTSSRRLLTTERNAERPLMNIMGTNTNGSTPRFGLPSDDLDINYSNPSTGSGSSRLSRQMSGFGIQSGNVTTGHRRQSQSQDQAPPRDNNLGDNNNDINPGNIELPGSNRRSDDLGDRRELFGNHLRSHRQHNHRDESHNQDKDKDKARGKTGEGYRDARAVTKAYFSISCASALGTALIRFSSAPDSFTLSQSWGWKSSALRTEEYLSGVGGINPSSPTIPSSGNENLEEGVLGWVGEISPGSSGVGVGGSLRASVVVGVV